MSPRTGRPKTVNPKSIDLKIRIDEKTNDELIIQAEKEKITRAELARKAIVKYLGN